MANPDSKTTARQECLLLFSLIINAAILGIIADIVSSVSTRMIVMSPFALSFVVLLSAFISKQETHSKPL